MIRAGGMAATFGSEPRRPEKSPGYPAILPVGIVFIPAGIIPMRGGIIVLPAGMVTFPTGITSFPTGIAPISAGKVTIPAGMPSLPTGKTTIPAGKMTLPAGIYPKNLKTSSLLFCGGDGGGHRHRRRGRIGGAVAPHLAADVLKFFGGGRPFAEQTGHGVNHAAGVVLGGISGILQIRRGLDMGHLVFLLNRRERVHRVHSPCNRAICGATSKFFAVRAALLSGSCM